LSLIEGESKNCGFPPGARTLGVRLLLSQSEFKKAIVVSQLKGARDRKRATSVKIEGRRNFAEIDREKVGLAKKLRRHNVRSRKRILWEIASKLAEAGFVTGTGKPYAEAGVAKMIAV
jgi:hypothetical protein